MARAVPGYLRINVVVLLGPRGLSGVTSRVIGRRATWHLIVTHRTLSRIISLGKDYPLSMKPEYESPWRMRRGREKLRVLRATIMMC